VFAALLTAPWLVVAGAIIGPLGLWLVDLRSQRRSGRESTGLPGARVALLIGYSYVALAAVVLVASLAWQAALQTWDVSQIDRLEQVGCTIPTLQAVDATFDQQAPMANSLLGWGAFGALVAIFFLLVRLGRRLHPLVRISAARADRTALLGFRFGVMSLLALLVAFSLGIVRWPPGLEGPAAIILVCTFPVSIVGSLLSYVGRSSRARRGLAVAGLVLSLLAVFVILGVGVLLWISFSQMFRYGSVSWRYSS
jgi:hypothetical protein